MGVCRGPELAPGPPVEDLCCRVICKGVEVAVGFSFQENVAFLFLLRKDLLLPLKYLQVIIMMFYKCMHHIPALNLWIL